MTAANNMGMWHRGVERGAEANLRQSNVRRQREASGFYSSYVRDFVLFCLIAAASICFLPAIYHR